MDIGFYNAIRQNKIGLVQKYIAEGHNPRVNDDEPLLLATQTGDWQMVKYFISLGCDPCSRDHNCLVYSAYYGYLSMLRYIVNLGCDVNVRNNLALKWAVQRDQWHIVKFLVESGCDIRDRYNEFMHTTYNKGYSECLFFFKFVSRRDQYHFANETYPLIFYHHRIMRGSLYYVCIKQIRSQITTSKNVRKHNNLKFILKPKSLKMQFMYFD
jgi:ankyrin repeat protein